MEVDFAFLADAAQVAGGKLYVIGGALDTINAKDAPINHPALSLVVKLIFSPAELDRQHKVEINLVTDDGKRVAYVGGDLTAARTPGLPSGWPQGFLTVLSFANLKFDAFGDYSFEVLVNNTSLKSVRLRIAEQK